MKRTVACLAAIAFCAAGSVACAVWSVSDKGGWPESWPKELEPLRKQSRTLVGGLANLEIHQIPFAKREAFESAWPHILKVKSQGAPVFLVRSPNQGMGIKIDAGVVVHTPPRQTDKRANPEKPLAGKWDGHERQRWIKTNYIELIVDGTIVDLNRIPLPADTPMIDERFTETQTKSPEKAK